MEEDRKWPTPPSDGQGIWVLAERMHTVLELTAFLKKKYRTPILPKITLPQRLKKQNRNVSLLPLNTEEDREVGVNDFDKFSFGLFRGVLIYVLSLSTQQIP